MTKLDGYLVVLRPELANTNLNNSKYRGLYRTPLDSMENYKRGFDNPYVFEKSISTDGLIPTIDLAHKARNKFTEIYQYNDLEIIYVQTSNGTAYTATDLANENFLGYDIAGIAPFWSIVGDCPLLSDPRFQGELSQLNNAGLFDSIIVAEEYFLNHLEHLTEGRDQGLMIWKVYLVES